MKVLQYSYHLQISFSEPVRNHSFTVRCMPKSDERQEITSQNISILPKEFLCDNEDSFGNSYAFGKAKELHNLFDVKVEGTARTGLSEKISAAPLYRLGMFSGQTKFTMPDDKLKSFFGGLKFPYLGGNLEKSLWIMEKFRENFSYRSGVTNIYTTAADAFNMGCGVCQDYSHIFLSLCRMAHIPCRYVVGMLIGEGASHAWVEICDDGFWYGLDPTNGTRVFDEHIKISHGRDFEDCRINQGVFEGNAVQSQTVAVIVKEAGE